MNNEPVAWMFQGAFDISTYVSFEKPNPDIYPNPTPLFTHLAKTLTDKEIKDIWCEVYNFKGYDCLTELDYKFCREMIRKAQEK
jgi:hypothetical protein